MTEKEASAKWCPFSRVAMPEHGSDEGIPVGNRYVSDDGGEWNHCLCIGSACMAWRTDSVLVGDGSPFLKEGEGHCGLAGKP